MPIIGGRQVGVRGLGFQGAGKPNAPTGVTATDVGTGRAYNNGAATVSFTPGSDNGAPVSTYTVTSSPGGYTNTGVSSPITITGLQSNTSYTFTVTATNAVGTSDASSASSSITATTVPQTPTIGTVTRTNNTTVSVPWTGATGGKSITSTTIVSSPSISISTSGTSSPSTATGTFVNNTEYTFTVSLTNANGTSDASSASNSVTPNPSYYVMVGDSGAVYQSSDLSSWTSITPDPTDNYYGVAKGAGVWAISGQNGKISSSTDLSTWTLRVNTGLDFDGDMKFGNNTFVATGLSKQLYTSTNGTSWTQRTSGFTNNIQIRGTVYNSANGIWVVCGNWDSTVGAQYSTANQADVSTWTKRNIWTAGTSAYKPDANNSVVAVPMSSGDLVRSSDGTTSWGGVSAGFTGTGGIAWGNGRWVQVGGSGQTSYSTSASAAGGTFTTVTVGSSTFYYVKFVNGQFVIGGLMSPTFYTSTDGITWTSRSAMSASQYGRSIAYG
jgi:hypothetical protein